MSTELLATPQAAIGSDFSPSRNRVWFVEYTGRIARVDLVRGLAGVVSSGTGGLQGTWSFDLDAGGGQVGVPGVLPPEADLWWEQMTSTARQLTPLNGAAIAWMGPVSFSSVSHADLQGLDYRTDPIDGSIGSNRLTPGTVLAVRTTNGNYAKVRVVSYGYNLTLEWRTYRLADRYAVVGTGYSEPEDIALSSDGVHAYVTERGGTLLRVDLGNANRSSAAVVSTGMTAPHQLVLDEPHGVAYVVEFAASGQLLRIDLATGARTTLFSGLQNAIGLAMSADAKTAYVTEQAPGGGRLVCLDLVNARRRDVVTGLVSPFFLEWTDAARSAVYLVERDPNNRVLIVPLNTAAPVTRVVLTGLPHRPSSMVDVGGKAVVCCDAAVVLEDLAPTWTVTDPFFLGIGHVPATHISSSGYATTDPGYFFQVSEAPFGGTLALQINHDRAFAQGARFYRILVDGVGQETPFSDYEWVGMLGTFVLRRTDPDASGYFPVRTTASLWYNHWLGYQLDTSGLSNGLHQIEVRFYTSASSGALLAQQSVSVQIDNTLPLVTIDAIEHQKADGTWETVGRCAIVDKPNNAFRLRITARDPERHLLSWSLGVAWGNNEGAGIDSATYVAGTTVWEGPVGQIAPSGGSWAAIEKRCAHTFTLSAWDRVINGWGYIHHASYSKSITMFLP